LRSCFAGADFRFIELGTQSSPIKSHVLEGGRGGTTKRLPGAGSLVVFRQAEPAGGPQVFSFPSTGGTAVSGHTQCPPLGWDRDPLEEVDRRIQPTIGSFLKVVKQAGTGGPFMRRLTFFSSVC
jgi:hypothetical protein